MNADDDARESSQPAGTPRWVKVFGVIALAAILLLVVALVIGRGGPHSPRRHAASVGAGAPPAGVPERHQPPPGAHAEPWR